MSRFYRDEDAPSLTSEVIEIVPGQTQTGGQKTRNEKGGIMTQTPTRITEQPRSPMVEGFARFWANPNPAVLPPLLAEDVVGHFPGEAEPIRGRDAYVAKIAQYLRLLPDLRLEVAEHATNGESTSSAGSRGQRERRDPSRCQESTASAFRTGWSRRTTSSSTRGASPPSSAAS